MPARRFKNVPFQFLNSEEEDLLVGIVELRSDSIVLDIQDPDTARSYLIHGKSVETYFVGSDASLSHDAPVSARWAAVGQHRFVGVWEEGATTYLFTFDLSEAARAAASARTGRHVDAMRYRLPGSFGTSRRQ